MFSVLGIESCDAFPPVLDDGDFEWSIFLFKGFFCGLGLLREVEIDFPDAVGGRVSPSLISRIFRIGSGGEKRFGNGVG